MNSRKPIIVRQVWEENLVRELTLIKKTVVNYPYVSMDTEFPGTIVRPNVPKHQLSNLHPLETYHFMRLNVDSLKLIQVGITLSDSKGNLPDYCTTSCYIWEFNFKDFDIDKDPCNPDSIELLKRQGIDFLKNKQKGIDSKVFSRLLLSSGLVLNPMITWVTFHSAYDFGFLVKLLVQNRLPSDLRMFMGLVNYYFGRAVFDMKHLMRFCGGGLYGGLEKVGKALGVERPTGNSHQAGSDSLMILQCFLKMREMYLSGERGKYQLHRSQCVLYGLEC